MGEFSVPIVAISMHTDGRITVRLQVFYWIEHVPGWS